MGIETILDELDARSDSPRRTGKQPLPGLSAEDIGFLKANGNIVAALAGETSDKSYVTLHRYANVTSNSILQSLHSCPRRLILEKMTAAYKADMEIEREPNIDFVFGHAVGAGIQTYLATDCDLASAIYAMMLAWKADWDFGKQDHLQRKKKTIERACIAVEMFAIWWQANMDEWEIYRLEDGTPAVELSFCLDFGEFKYFGHIDMILRNKVTGRIAIGENKTSGYVNPDDAAYRNSGQALGYAVVLDKIVQELADYDVHYFAYSAPGEEWHHFPFAKTVASKLEWIQDRLIDFGHLRQYYQLRHFPKNGASCLQFNRRCQFYGECDLVDKERMMQLEVLDKPGDEYPVNYYFHVQDLINRQLEAVR